MNDNKGAIPTSDTRPVITPIKDGPLRVQGLKTFEGVEGALDPQPEMALCRCGLSANKPFCDGSHVPAGFTDEKQDDREPDRRDTFEGDPVTIFENVAICSHAGFCPNGAPDKWRPKTDSGGHTDEELVPMIRKCPSGALSYSTDGLEHRDQDRPCAVRVAKAGPYWIEGGIELENADWAEGASHEHYTLCRCGGSKRKSVV